MKPSIPHTRLWAGAAAAVCLLATAPAGAATFKPTRSDDPPPGECKPNDCSLREAVKAADEQPDRDTILLGKETYELEIAADVDNQTVENGDLDLGYPVTIRGEGPKPTKIDANGVDRVFKITPNSVDDPATILKGLTVKGGDATAGASPMQTPIGGGIWVYSSYDTLKLLNVAVRQNEAVLGGGIRGQAKRLIIKKSTIAQNAASEGGGLQLPPVIFSQAVTKISSSSIAGNFSSKGGGILADGYSSSALPVPDVDLVNSTVAGNHAANEGGGIMADNGASVALDNSTVAYNIANDDNIGSAVAGGIHQHSGATFTLGDSIIASNLVGQGGSDPDCSGAFNGSGNVLIAASGCGDLTAGPNQFVGSALIGQLAKNGGPTQTIEALATSPALGFAETCPGRDQRGVKRPGNGCDSGSYERKKP